MPPFDTYALVAPAIAFVASYLVGALPVAWLLARRERGIDLRRVGTGGTGALDALLSAGIRTAVLAVIVEVIKGGFVGVAAHLYNPSGWFVAVAIAGCVVGDAFPVGFRRGGRGLVPLLSGLVTTLPEAALICAVVALPVSLATRMHGRVYDVTVAVAVPAGLFLDTRDGRSLIAAGIIVLALVVRAQQRRVQQERTGIGNRQHPLVIEQPARPESR
ncbi:MAG: glycerol-3-phosphate acyltransferase [Candidatus Dormibacteria bacterium]